MKSSQVVRLESVDSLEEIERALEGVHAYRGNDLVVFASALDKRRGALRDAAFLQLLVTWARINPEANISLRSNADVDREAIIKEACGYSVGIAALSLAGGIKVVGKMVSRTAALSPAKERIDAAYEGKYDLLMKGRTVDLLCVSGAERQFLKPLFSKPSVRAVKDKFDLKSTVRGLAMQANPGKHAIDEDAIFALATLTHELFENTQEHAITDVDGIDYRRHIELVTASWITHQKNEALNDLMENETLRNYWKRLDQVQSGRREVAGICFSFLDSGPGMAARLLGKPYFKMKEKEERDALHKCLRMHVTSKNERATGGGFESVLTAVAQANGFVRIRSGRQAIFKCFPPGDEQEAICENFENWFEDSRTLLRVAGTLISVFIPASRSSVL